MNTNGNFLVIGYSGPEHNPTRMGKWSSNQTLAEAEKSLEGALKDDWGGFTTYFIVQFKGKYAPPTGLPGYKRI
jgi:hypothetical protein